MDIKQNVFIDTLGPTYGPNCIYVGIKSIWYKKYIQSNSNIYDFIITMIECIIDYYDIYITMADNDATYKMPNIFTADLACDCDCDAHNKICHRNIIIEIIRILFNIETIHDPLTIRLDSNARKQILMDRIFVGNHTDDPFVVEGTILNNKYKIVRRLIDDTSGCLFLCTEKKTNYSRRADYVVIKMSRCTKVSIHNLDSEYQCLNKLNKIKSTNILLAQDNDVYFPKVLEMFFTPSHSWNTCNYNQVIVFERYGSDLYESVLNNQFISHGLKPIQIHSIFKQLAKTIKVVHDADIIHKDIKCENLLLRKMGHTITQDSKAFDIVLIDYGLSIDINKRNKCSNTPNDKIKFNTTCGTITYMSPEEILGRDYDKSVDIFSIGLIIVEMYKGSYILPDNASHVLNIYKKIFIDFPIDEYNKSLITPAEYALIIKNISKKKSLSLHHDKNNVPYQKDYLTHGITDLDLVDLLKQCFELDPKKRITIANILQHPYITKTII